MASSVDRWMIDGLRRHWREQFHRLDGSVVVSPRPLADDSCEPEDVFDLGERDFFSTAEYIKYAAAEID